MNVLVEEWLPINKLATKGVCSRFDIDHVLSEENVKSVLKKCFLKTKIKGRILLVGFKGEEKREIRYVTTGITKV